MKTAALLAEVERWLGGARLDEARRLLESAGEPRVVLLGARGSGKTSLLRALTGQEPGPGGEVRWGGVVWVDTPGLGERGTEAERQAWRAAHGADLILFVVSSELFDEALAAQFRWLVGAEGMAMEGQVALVVTKADRGDPGALLAGATAAVASSAPVLCCSPRNLLDAGLAPEHLRGRLLRASGFEAMLPELDAFVARQGPAGRRAAPLRLIERAALKGAERAASEVSDAARAVELLRRQRRVIDEAARSLEHAADRGAEALRREASAVGEEAARELRPASDQRQVDALSQRHAALFAERAEAVFAATGERATSALERASQELQDLGRSALGRAVSGAEARRQRPGVQVEVEQVDDGEAVRKVKSLVEKPLRLAAEQAAKNPAKIAGWIVRTGEALGTKIPWDAVKLGKDAALVAGHAARVMPVLGAAVEAWLAYRREAAEDDRNAQVVRLRIVLHQHFDGLAAAEEQALREGVRRLQQATLGEALAVIAADEARLDASAREARERGVRLGDLAREARRLRVRAGA